VLPEGSLYKPIENKWNKTSVSQEMAIPTDQYARQVVDQLVKNNKPREIWRGGKATLVKILSGWFPASVLVSASSVLVINTTLFNAKISRTIISKICTVFRAFPALSKSKSKEKI
jgi:hypothetical protein